MTKLKVYLDARGISQSDLSFATKIPYPTMVKYVDGTISNPPVERINEMLRVLGCAFEDIY